MSIFIFSFILKRIRQTGLNLLENEKRCFIQSAIQSIEYWPLYISFILTHASQTRILLHSLDALCTVFAEIPFI